jgi:hypothetical protein
VLPPLRAAQLKARLQAKKAIRTMRDWFIEHWRRKRLIDWLGIDPWIDSSLAQSCQSVQERSNAVSSSFAFPADGMEAPPQRGRRCAQQPRPSGMTFPGLLPRKINKEGRVRAQQRCGVWRFCHASDFVSYNTCPSERI